MVAESFDKAVEKWRDHMMLIDKKGDLEPHQVERMFQSSLIT